VGELSDRTAAVVKEFPGGYRGEFRIALPAVLGVQAAEKPPRYVPVAKVRAAMKAAKIEAVQAPAGGPAPWEGLEVLELAKPEAARQAEILQGAPEEAAAKLCALLAERGLL